jgi:hypothetical protein
VLRQASRTAWLRQLAQQGRVATEPDSALRDLERYEFVVKEEGRYRIAVPGLRVGFATTNWKPKKLRTMAWSERRRRQAMSQWARRLPQRGHENT